MSRKDKAEEPYEVFIDGQRIIVDPSQSEDYVKGFPDEPDDPHPVDQFLPADPDAAAAMRSPSTNKLYAGLRPTGTSVLCRNDRCTNLVSPSLNPGRAKIFCSRKCAHNHHNRLYEKRAGTKGRWFLERDKITGEQYQLDRTMPPNLEAAEMRYKSHIMRDVCPQAEPGHKCPSHELGDYYSSKRLCLIYATLVDDLYEQFAKARGRLYVRRWTSESGRWVEYVDLPHLREGDRTSPSDASASDAPAQGS